MYTDKDAIGTYYRVENNNEWHVHQCYEESTDTKTVRCKNCVSKEFMVGLGVHFTAIKCIKC